MTINEWAIWDGGNYTCFDIVHKSVEASYNSGLRSGLIWGCVIGLVLAIITVKLATHFHGNKNKEDNPKSI